MIDIRNSYEAAIGRFDPPKGGAEYIDPKMRLSTEFPDWIDANLEKLKDKQVMMFCTGGVRCERASALLKSKGHDKGVYQLFGGIHKYLEEFKNDGRTEVTSSIPIPIPSPSPSPHHLSAIFAPAPLTIVLLTGGHWIGKNYVFDKRFAHGAPGKEDEVVGKCVSCENPWDKYRGRKKCPQCAVPLLICIDCQEQNKHFTALCNLCQEVLSTASR